MTKRWLLGATTAVALIATPALAANDSAQSSEPAKAANNAQQAIDEALKDRDTPGAVSGSASDETADGDHSAGATRGDDRAMAQRRLRRALKEAGFTDIRILGATYRIRARDDNGNTVFLRISPGMMDRHGMSKHDMDRGATDDNDRAGDDTASIDLNRGAAIRGETTGAGDGGKAYGAGPMAPRGESAGYGDRQAGGDPSAFDRIYDQGFRDGYNRGFDRAQGWR
ncbi:MAG: hypothetical protein JSR61_03755 [Proteobacteria bacterium]|nr:hypothetical protein [Pseudomonadota bacterium]